MPTLHRHDRAPDRHREERRSRTRSAASTRSRCTRRDQAGRSGGDRAAVRGARSPACGRRTSAARRSAWARRPAARPHWKKAIVTLREGETIEASSRAERVMGIRQFKPVTKGTRFRSVADFSEITRSTPEKSLLEPLKKSGGRDNHGHISMRRRGGGHKRMYRIIDFKRDKLRRRRRPCARSSTIRTARRASRWCEYADGEKRYILHPKGLGGRRHRSCRARARTSALGNALPLREIPLGTDVHNVELKIGKGGQMARSAGMSRAGRREGRRVRHAALGVERDAPGARQLPGDDRRGRQRGARAAVVRARRARRAGRDVVRRCAAKS